MLLFLINEGESHFLLEIPFTLSLIPIFDGPSAFAVNEHRLQGNLCMSRKVGEFPFLTLEGGGYKEVLISCFKTLNILKIEKISSLSV